MRPHFFLTTIVRTRASNPGRRCGCQEVNQGNNVEADIIMRCLSVVTAEYDYTAQTDEELSFYEGQVLFLLETEDENWYKALLIFPGPEGGWERQEGLVPATYISSEASEPIWNVTATYAYDATGDDEITLIEGEYLWIYDDRDKDWWLAAKSLPDGTGIDVGLVPSTYVSKEDGDQAAEPEASLEIPLENGASSESMATYAPDSLRTYVASLQDKKNKRRNHKCLVGTDQTDIFILSVDDRSIIHRFPLQETGVNVKQGKNSIGIRNENHHFVIELDDEDGYELLSLELDAVGADDKDKKGGLKGVLKKWGSVKGGSAASSPGHKPVASETPAVKQSIGAPNALAPPPLLEKSPAASGKTKSTSNSSFQSSLAAGNPRKLAVALFDFAPETDQEVEIQEGDNLVIIDDESDPDWTQVRVVSSRGKKEGLVPRSYIEIKQPGVSTTNSRDDVRSETQSEHAREPSPEPEPELPPPPPLAKRPVLSDRAPSLPPQPVLPSQPQVLSRPNVSEDQIRKVLASHASQRAQAESEGSETGSDAPPPMLPPGRDKAEREYLSRVTSSDVDEHPAIGGPPPPLAPRPQVSSRSRSSTERSSPAPEPARSQSSESKPALLPRPAMKSLNSQPSNAASRAEAQEAAAHPSSSSQSSARSPPAKHSLPNSSALRSWQDRTGTFKVQAEFLGYQDNKVHLHKANGVKIAVAIEKLSQPDIDHVFDILGEPKPRHLQGNPARTSSLKPGSSSPSDSSSQQPPPVASKVSPTSTQSSSKPTFQQRECVYNDFDWYKFLTEAGIPHTDAVKYGSKFAKERLDATILSDLSRDMLKDLHIPEGDIIRIMRSANAFRPGGPGLGSKIQAQEQKLMKQNMATIDGLVAGKLQEQEAKAKREEREAQERKDAELARAIQQIERTNLASTKKSPAPTPSLGSGPGISVGGFSAGMMKAPSTLPAAQVPSKNDFEADFSQLSQPSAPVLPTQPVKSVLPPPLIPTPSKPVASVPQTQPPINQFPGFPTGQLGQAANQMALVPSSAMSAVSSLNQAPGGFGSSGSGQFNNSFPNPALQQGFAAANSFSTSTLPTAMGSTGFGMSNTQGPRGVFAGGGHPGLQNDMMQQASSFVSSTTSMPGPGFQPSWAPPGECLSQEIILRLDEYVF